jgi:enediyne biosynthesis protein CalE5
VTKQTFDPVRYKAAQRTDWSTAAEGWRKWWRTIEDGLGPIAERLVELAALERGDRVLDVATGIGEPAVTAARRVGPEGRVVATDIAPGMLDIGRERAAELGLDNVEFREADAEELELPDEQFDAVLSRNGLMFFPDLPAALERMRAVLVGGGRLAAAVWGRPEQTPFIAVTHRTVARELGLPPPAPGTPGPLSLSDADALESRLRQAGFADVRSERMTISVDFDSAEAYVDFTRAVSVPLKNLLEGESTERKEEVWSAVASSAREHAAGDGSLSLPGEVICVVGLAPGR